jgi:hypothetical protein
MTGVVTPADLREFRAITHAKCEQLHAAAPYLLRWDEQTAVAAFRGWHESYQEWLVDWILSSRRRAAMRAGVVDGGRK